MCPFFPRRGCDTNRVYTDPTYPGYTTATKDMKRVYCLTDAKTNLGQGNFGVAYWGSLDKQVRIDIGQKRRDCSEVALCFCTSQTFPPNFYADVPSVRVVELQGRRQ